MSKVVHLSNDAHAKAKDFCKEKGVRMSDWVATLIDEAVSRGKADTQVRHTVGRKKPLKRLENTPEPEDPNVPAYAAPPFWEKKSGS